MKIFDDIKSIQKAIDSIKDEGQRDRAEKLLADISVRTLHELHVMSIYRRHIKDVMEDNSTKDVSSFVSRVIEYANKDINRKIVLAKRKDIKKKREYEKSTVLSWYKKNANELKKIIALNNILEN